MNNAWFSADQIFEVIPQELLLTESGLDLCHRMIAGELPPPPMGGTMNFRMAEAEAGRVVFRGTPLERHLTPAGVIHGGWAATILDSALGCCVWTQVPVGKAYTTAEFKVHLVRPLTPQTGELICEAKVVHMGRSLATCEGTLKTPEGKLVAHGTETCAIYDPVRR